MATPLRQSRVLRLLNPFSRIQVGQTADQRLAEAVEACRRADPAALVEELEWFGWEPSDGPGGRYMLVGFEPDAEHGVGRGCGYLVDTVSGHVVWTRPIERRRDLPLTMTAVMSAQKPPIH